MNNSKLLSIIHIVGLLIATVAAICTKSLAVLIPLLAMVVAIVAHVVAIKRNNEGRGVLGRKTIPCCATPRVKETAKTHNPATLKRLEAIAKDLTMLVASKNHSYGESFYRAHLILEQLYPNGVKVKDYPDLLTITRMVDKTFRIATGEEDNTDNWSYLAGYSLLSLDRVKCLNKDKD